MRPAVFLDRDGTINREVHYLSRAADFEPTGSVLWPLLDVFFFMVSSRHRLVPLQ